MTRVTLKMLTKRTGGGCSNPSKMPGTSWNISAKHCNVGGRLRKCPGSVCEKCYAHKGRYVFPKVQNALERRLVALHLDTWAEDMAEIIRRKSKGYHRWHDSGDLTSRTHLEKIVQIVKATPDVKHWLPSKEYQLIRKYLENHNQEIPKNLCIRMSAPMKGKRIKGWKNTSMVLLKGQKCPKGVHECPAPTQGGECGTCRACWDNTIECVAYHNN